MVRGVRAPVLLALVLGLLVPCVGWCAPLGGGLLFFAYGRGVGALLPAFCGCCASRVSPVCVLSFGWGVLLCGSLVLFCGAGVVLFGVRGCGWCWLGLPFFPLSLGLSPSLFSLLVFGFCVFVCLCWGGCGFLFVGFGLGFGVVGAFFWLVRCMLARGAHVRLLFLVVSVGLCGFCWRRCVGCHVAVLRVIVIVMSEKEERKKRAWFLLVVVSFADYVVIY